MKQGQCFCRPLEMSLRPILRLRQMILFSENQLSQYTELFSVTLPNTRE